jgi:hypothetical protein
MGFGGGRSTDRAADAADQGLRAAWVRVRVWSVGAETWGLAAGGAQIAPQMLQIKGRVLPPPVITYGRGATITPDAGAWNLRGVNFYEPKALKAWGIVVRVRTTDVTGVRVS